MTESSSNAGDLAGRLSEWLSRRHDDHVRVSGLALTSAGARRTNALFESTSTSGCQRLALTLVPSAAIQLIDITAEVATRALAQSAGVPVPHVHDVCTDETVLGGPFFISTAVEGETIPRRVLRLAEEHGIGHVVIAQIGEAMARLHSIDPAEAPSGITHPTGAGPIDTAIGIAERLLNELTEPSPTFAYAVRWLERNAPSEPERCAVTHADIRTGNVIVGPEGLRSILDWEAARVSDPMQDVAWPCQRMWRFGNDALTVGGLSTTDVLRTAYTSAGGTWDDDRFRWWRVLGSVWWGLTLAEQARSFLSGDVDSIVMAASGRRVAELEFDTLMLIRPR